VGQGVCSLSTAYRYAVEIFQALGRSVKKWSRGDGRESCPQNHSSLKFNHQPCFLNYGVLESVDKLSTDRALISALLLHARECVAMREECRG
jgi:hypothetical protein